MDPCSRQVPQSQPNNKLLLLVFTARCICCRAVSVTCMCCTKTTQLIIKQLALDCSLRTEVYRHKTWNICLSGAGERVQKLRCHAWPGTHTCLHYVTAVQPLWCMDGYFSKNITGWQAACITKITQLTNQQHATCRRPTCNSATALCGMPLTVELLVNYIRCTVLIFQSHIVMER